MARALEEGVPRLADALTGDVPLTPQAEHGVAYAAKLAPAERLLDPAESAVLADRRVRALSPHIGAAIDLGGERFVIWEAAPAVAGPGPGQVAVDDGRILCGFADGALELMRLQAPGRRAMTAVELLRGWRRPLGPAARAG
jgi:methionyl-tRNA formyltransferase